MDLQDFEGQAMYFDDSMPEGVDELIEQAAAAYGEGGAEPYLDQARKLAPDNLVVLVAVYRFYYYQHRLEDAIQVAYRVMEIVGPEIGFPTHWRDLESAHLANGVMHSFTRVRFYLLALKGAGYLKLRLGEIATGVEMLGTVVAFDSKDRLGAKSLLRAMGPAVVAG